MELKYKRKKIPLNSEQYVHMNLVEWKINVYRVSHVLHLHHQVPKPTSAIIFLQFLHFYHCIYLSNVVWLHFLRLMFPLWCPLTSPPLALRCRVSGSIFSPAQWVIPALVTLSFSPPACPHLFTSSHTRLLSIWLAAWPELSAALINTSVSGYHHDWGYGSVTTGLWKVSKGRRGWRRWGVGTVSVYFWLTVSSTLSGKRMPHVITGSLRLWIRSSGVPKCVEGWLRACDRRSSYLILRGFCRNEKLLFNFIIQ